MNRYRAVIGLEVHIQLLTERKMFCEEACHYGAPPNTQVSPTTLAHPGTLPVPNKKAIEHAVTMGLACQCNITRYNHFDRKNYFYPDLPKGFQITQNQTPICKGGFVEIRDAAGKVKRIDLERIHLEEDTGKSIHTSKGDLTLVNYDRAGKPLIELVTKPVLENADEAYAFLQKIRQWTRYLGISNGNMEEGSLRCDANISIMKEEETVFGQKVEVKNMNSIRQVRLAILHEIKRQIALKEAGKEIVAATRAFDETTGKTVFRRKKETGNDYRYFPEPDISPFEVDEAWLEKIRQHMPPLPEDLIQRFISVYGVPEEEAVVLADEKKHALFFDQVCRATSARKEVAHWMLGPVRSYLNQEKVDIEQFPLSVACIAQLADLVASKRISFSIASQQLFVALLSDPTASPLQKAETLHLLQIDDQATLQAWVDQVVGVYPEQVKRYKAGKKGLLGFFMKGVMEKSQYQANPALAAQLLRKKLEH